jgi:mannosyltransferase
MHSILEGEALNKRYELGLFVIIMLLATLVRVWALNRSTLWWDEGNNAYFAHQSLAGVLEMSRLTHDTDPPAHRLALGLWLRLLGDSVFNLRLFSAALGIATVGLVFQWGRWLAGPREGLLAALLATLSPILVYYSREAKGYPFVTFFGLLALYLWARYLDSPKRAHPVVWGAYVLAETLAIGAHYYAFLLVAAQALWLGLSVPRDHARRGEARQRILGWLGAQVAVGALLLPWVLLTFGDALSGAHNVPMNRGALALLPYLRDTLFSLSAGPCASVWIGVLATAILGCAALWQMARGQPDRVGLLATVAFVPVVLSFFIQIRLPFFSARFLLYAAPALCLLAALGLTRLRRIGLVLCVGLVAVWAAAFPSVYAPFVGPEEDMRPLAQPLRALAQPGDGVVVGYIWQEGILRMLVPTVPLDYHLGWFTAETVEEQMSKLLAEHKRLWLVTYRAPLQHPQNPGGWWLEQHAARALVTENGYGRIVLYLAPCTMAQPDAQTVDFAEHISLTYAPLVERVVAGQPISVALQWSVSTPPTRGYAVYMHLYDQDGKLWAQSDGLPMNGLRPFAQFTANQPVKDCRAVLILPEMPPGRYALRVGLYDTETGKRLQVTSGAEAGADHCVIGQVDIVTK